MGLYGAFAGGVGRAGRLGLVVVGLGLTLVMIGDLGGAWFGFARSGNFLIGPGHILTMAGLIVFSMSARRTSIQRRYQTLAVSIALLPVAFFPLATGLAVLTGDQFPPSLHDNYFRILYVLGSLLWLALGTTLLRDSRTTTGSA